MTRIGPLTRRLHCHAGPHGPLILMYHSIQGTKGTPTWPWAISRDNFRRQLDFLAAEDYATPTLAALVSNPSAFPIRTAVITFDDGYVDNLAALEDLKARNMKATWFIVTGSIGSAPRWPTEGGPRGRLLNATELRELHASGMEIGSHTVSHLRLTQVDDATLQAELGTSKKMLEDLLGAPITSFAYPYGDWNDRCAAFVEKAGYLAACTTRPGWALRDGDTFKLRRLSVFNNDTPAGLARKISLGSNRGDWPQIWRYFSRRLIDWII